MSLMSTYRQIRDTLWVWYWSCRLLGHRVDPAKNIIYRTVNWSMFVEDGTHKFRAGRYHRYRLHLHTNPDTGRIMRLSIG